MAPHQTSFSEFTGEKLVVRRWRGRNFYWRRRCGVVVVAVGVMSTTRLKILFLFFSCWLIYSQSLSTLCPTVKIREAVK